jgi:hypothetical protein
VKGLFIFCVVVGMVGIIYSLCLSWERIQVLQERVEIVPCEHDECDHHYPAP